MYINIYIYLFIFLSHIYVIYFYFIYDKINHIYVISHIYIIYIYILATLCGVCDLSFPTRDQTRVPCIGSMKS